jgi:hypothetical protein
MWGPFVKPSLPLQYRRDPLAARRADGDDAGAGSLLVKQLRARRDDAPPVAPKGCPAASEEPVTLSRVRSIAPSGASRPRRSLQKIGSSTPATWRAPATGTPRGSRRSRSEVRPHVPAARRAYSSEQLAEPFVDRDRHVGGRVGASGDADLDLAEGDLVGDRDGGLERGVARLLKVSAASREPRTASRVKLKSRECMSTAPATTSPRRSPSKP